MWLILAILYAPIIYYFIAFVFVRANIAYVYSLLLYSTYLGFVGQTRLGMSISFIIALSLGAFELLIAIIRKNSIAKMQIIDYTAILLMIWVTISIIFQNGERSFIRPIITLPIILMGAKFRSKFNRDDFDKLSTAIILGGIITSFVCIAQAYEIVSFSWISVPSKGFFMGLNAGRVSGLQGNPNATAFYILMSYCALVSIQASLKRRYYKHAIQLLVAGLMIFALYQTGSRAAMLVTLGLTGVYISNVIDIKWQYITTLIVIVSAIYVFLQQEQGNQLASNFVGVREDEYSTQVFSDESRMDIFKIAIQTIYKHPIIGDSSPKMGYGHIFYHNDIVQLAADFGIPAALIFITHMLMALQLLYLNTKANGSTRAYGGYALKLCIAGIVFSMSHGLILSGIAYWMIIGLAINGNVRK